MVEQSSLDVVYAALSDPARRAIITRLAEEDELRVTEIALQFPMSLNAVSKHIKVLERAGLVHRRRDGREHRLTLNPAPLAEAWGWIGLYQRFWETRLDALEAYLKRRREQSPRRETDEDGKQ